MLLFFLVLEFYRRGISNRVELTSQFLMIFSGPKEAPEVIELGHESHGLPTRVGGAPTPSGGAPLSRGQPGDLPDLCPTPKNPINTETFGN